MEKLTKNLSLEQFSEREHVTYYIGDVHEGAANFDENAFLRAVALIEKDGDLWFGLGDYLDCINYHDKRFDPTEISARYSIRDLGNLPKVQAESFLKMTKPIWGKCGGLIEGNHEHKFMQYNTFDVAGHLSDVMGCPNLGGKAWISLNFEISTKGFPIKIVLCHGAGGGGIREGYPVNKVHDVFRWDVADVHVMGHLHQMQTDRAQYNSMDYGTFRKDSSWFAVNGCFLLKSSFGNGGYFEQRPGKESSIGMVRQTIRPSSRAKHLFDINLEKIYL